MPRIITHSGHFGPARTDLRIRALHSHHAGVSLVYLMDDFTELAMRRSGEEDPTFHRLKEVGTPKQFAEQAFRVMNMTVIACKSKCKSFQVSMFLYCGALLFTTLQSQTYVSRPLQAFWFGEIKIGSDLRCPRDGRLGCALVDWLPPEHRQRQTHFMSSDWRPEMFPCSDHSGTKNT